MEAALVGSWMLIITYNSFTTVAVSFCYQNTHFAGRVGTFVDVRTFGLVLTASKGCLKLVLMFGFELTLSLRVGLGF